MKSANQKKIICGFAICGPSQYVLNVRKLFRQRPSLLSLRHAARLTEYPLVTMLGMFRILCFLNTVLGFYKQHMGARNRVGIGLSYRPARLHRLAGGTTTRFLAPTECNTSEGTIKEIAEEENTVAEVVVQ